MYSMGMTGKKWEIFQAALDLFARDGYHNVSMRQIAQAAKIQPSSIYNHFPGKDTILEQMYEYFRHYSRQIRPSFEELFAYLETHSPTQTMRQIVHSYPEEIKDNMYKILSIASAAGNDVRAAMLLDETFVYYPVQYSTTLLNHMMEKNLIEPVDVEAFGTLYSCVCRSFTLRTLGLRPVSSEQWDATIGQLLLCLRERNREETAESQ